MFIPSSVTHHFSEHTLLSLELPIGWLLLKESPGTALYGQRLLSDELTSRGGEATSPRLALKTFLLRTDDPHAFQRLSEQPLEVPGQTVELLSSEACDVDFQPGRTTWYARTDAHGQHLLHMQTFFQVGRVVGSMTALGPLDQRETLQPLFEQVRASLRYIPRRRSSADV